MNKLILGTVLAISLANAEVYKLDYNNPSEIAFKTEMYEGGENGINCTKRIQFGKGSNKELVSLKGTVECNYGKRKVVLETVDYRNNKIIYSKYDAFGVRLNDYEDEYCGGFQGSIYTVYVEISNNLSRNSIDFNFESLKANCGPLTKETKTEERKKYDDDYIEMLTYDTDNCPASWQLRGRCLKSYFRYQ